MPKSKKLVSKPKIVLFPPQVMVSKRSNKYDLFINVRWGDFEQELKFSKETPAVWERAIEGITKSLLEASETTQPYI